MPTRNVSPFKPESESTHVNIVPHTPDPSLQMAQTSYPPANTISVVSPHYLAPYPVDLTIVKKLLSLSDGNFAVTDVNGNVMFKVKGKHISLRDRRVLLDAAGNPILSFQKKLISVHNRWVVFRGDSSDSKDMIFSAKQSSLIQFKTALDVFLGHNEKENVCHFKVKGSWFDRSCTIYAGDGTTIIAQPILDLGIKCIQLVDPFD